MYYIVVKRGDFGTYDLLHKSFGQKTPLLWDRRRNDRRDSSAAATTVPEERRRSERRTSNPPSWAALNFVVFRRAS